MKVIASLLLLAVGAIAELVPVSPFPGKGVMTSRSSRGEPVHAVINNKIYVFGGSYDLPYIVDPSNFDEPFGGRQDRSNVSSEVYSYNMDTDQWKQEETTTPYPLKRGSTQVVGDAVYFMGTEFVSNATRSIDVWKYDTADNTWDQVTRLGFVWLGDLITCERDGKIYITGSRDGRQLNIIHIYDTVSNAWLKPIVVKEQLRIHEIWCLDNGLLQVLAEPVCKRGEPIVFSNSGQTRPLNTYTIHTDGSAIQNELVIDHYNLQRVAVKSGVLYIFDNDRDQAIISSIDLTTQTKHELGRVENPTFKPIFVPYGDATFLFGGRPRRVQRSGVQIRVFNHKYVFGTKFNVQN